MSDILLDTLSWILLVGGSFFALIGGIGLHRLPDFYTRMHAGGITDTLGAGLILAGLGLQAGLTLAGFKILTVLFFLLVTSPTATHALAKAAGGMGIRPRLAKTEDRPSHT